jgi:hypothetical protein
MPREECCVEVNGEPCGRLSVGSVGCDCDECTDTPEGELPVHEPLHLCAQHWDLLIDRMETGRNDFLEKYGTDGPDELGDLDLDDL